MKFHKTLIFNICLAGAFIFLFIFVSGALALNKEDEIRMTWRNIVDKELTDEELQIEISNYKGEEVLRKELNNSTERDLAIRNIYQRAIKRDPLTNEIDFLKRVSASTGAIRNQLFSSEERILAIRDVYLGLLGREPSESALNFYFKTRPFLWYLLYQYLILLNLYLSVY